MNDNDQNSTVLVSDEEVLAEIEKDNGTKPLEETPKEEKTTVEETVPAEEAEESEEESDIDSEESEDEDAILDDSKQIPLAKFQKEKKKWKNQLEQLQKEFDSIKANPVHKESDNSDTIMALADKYAVNKDFLRELYGLIPKQSISQEDMLLIKEIREEMAAKKQARELEKKYLAEINSLKKDNPTLDLEDLNTSKLKKLKMENPQTPLSILFRAYKDEIILPKAKRGLESSSKEILDDKPNYSKMSEEDALKLSDEEFEKWAEAKGKNDTFLKK